MAARWGSQLGSAASSRSLLILAGGSPPPHLATHRGSLARVLHGIWLPSGDWLARGGGPQQRVGLAAGLPVWWVLPLLPESLAQLFSAGLPPGPENHSCSPVGICCHTQRPAVAPSLHPEACRRLTMRFRRHAPEPPDSHWRGSAAAAPRRLQQLTGKGALQCPEAHSGFPTGVCCLSWELAVLVPGNSRHLAALQGAASLGVLQRSMGPTAGLLVW